MWEQASPKDGLLWKIGRVIEELSQHLERCAEMGRNGWRFILENLTREVGTQKYVEVIKSVVAQ